MKPADLFKLALESEQDSVNQEIEYAFFMLIEDLDEIKSMATKVEVQEQYELFVKKESHEGTIRVRSIDGGNYTCCCKVNLPDEVGKRELEIPTTKDFFDLFIYLAGRGFNKTRYVIPSDKEGLVWEVDVYQDRDGKPVEWVKVDLEVPNAETELPTIPFKYNKAIFRQPADRTPEQVEFIGKLFSERYDIV